MHYLTNERVRKFIETQINLPSPPSIATQILDTLQKEDFCLDELERIVSADPALASKMLRLANSSFYSLSSEVSNVNRALSVLGTKVVKNIALSFVIASDLYESGEFAFDFDYFWRRSVTSAVAADLVCEAINVKDDDIFVTSLLQDIGVLLMFFGQRETYLSLFKRGVADLENSLHEVEREHYGFDHQRFGALVLEEWGIPASISTPILYHHDVSLAPDNWVRKVSVLNVADLLSKIYTGKDAGQNVRLLQKKLKEYFSLDGACINSLLDNVAIKSAEILDIFEIDSGDMKPYSLMLQEANDELGKLNLTYQQLVYELRESRIKAVNFSNELREANDRLETLAFQDSLTNLYNHRYFQEVLGREIARYQRYGKPLSLILFDIDHFKNINDTYGHPAGDKVLIAIAVAVNKAVRPSDVVARYGGEEFAVILPETNFSGVKVFAERLRRCVQDVLVECDKYSIQVTISCGAAQVEPSVAITQSELIAVADKALYRSKAAGRNRVTAIEVS
ncbi:MAG: GGDEF domain-containing protein [Desulfotalea sp.]